MLSQPFGMLAIRMDAPSALHRPVQNQSDGTNYVIVSSIDNLIKGASGQAVQNMNIVLGLPETTGLL